MELQLKRLYYPTGTNGDLIINDELFSHTIELPWKENEHGISCIPEGRYEIEKRHSDHLGDHMLLKNVPNRDLILIHPANNALKELRGCIATVLQLQGPGLGLRSRIPFERLQKDIYQAIDKGESVYITITSKI